MTKHDWLIGSWDLISFDMVGPNESVLYPLGDDAKGRLIYTTDGCMSAVLMSSNPDPFKSDDITLASSEEWGKAASSFICYCGEYSVQEDSIIHKVDLSLYPNWIGDDMVRKFNYVDGILHLTAAVEREGTSELYESCIKWKKHC